VWQILPRLCPGPARLPDGYKTLYLNMNRFIEKIATAKLAGTALHSLNWEI
jgi:hypothetical protein